MNRTLARALNFLRLGVNTASFTGEVMPLPGGMVADSAANFGLLALMANLSALDWDVQAVVGGSATTINLTGAQFGGNVIDYSGSPGGGVTMNTPTLAAILGAMPPTIPAVGFNFPLLIINDAAGQTATVTSGGTGVTVVGTATIATNTVRLFIVNVTPTSVTLVNCGGWSL